MPWNTLSEELAKSEVVGEFTLEESRAFADLAVLVMMIDERVTNAELEELTEQLHALPFEDAEEIEAKLSDQIAWARQTVDQVIDDQKALDSFIEETAAKIEGESHRMHALELLSALAYSDDVDVTEEDVVFRIGRAFGFSRAEIDDALMHGSLGSITE